MNKHTRTYAGGFTYLAMLFAVAIAGILLAQGGIYWSQYMQRQKEAELLKIGREFRRAIGLYYERTPGSVKRYPSKLQDLLKDERYLSLQRYLRKIYRDPMTGAPTWALIAAPDGGIMGIHSLSKDQPIKIGGFPDDEQDFDDKKSYEDWEFKYVPQLLPEQPSPS